MRINDVLGATIQGAGLGETNFEEFVGILVRDEQRRRHPTADVRGPGKTKAPDGGRDIVLDVKQPPTDPDRALTSDAVGKTFYSCKTSYTWHGSVQKDLGLAAARAAEKPPRKAATRKPGSARASTPQGPSDALLRHIAEGGRYVVVTDQMVGDDDRETIRTEAEKAFSFWLSKKGLDRPASLRDQVDLIGATELADYLRRYRPLLPAPLREQLGIVDEPGLKSWEQWGSEFEEERGLPGFVSDATRQPLIAALQFASTTNRIIRVVGPPGIGKTRAVYEALLHTENPSASVFYTSAPDVGHKAIERGWLSATHRVIVVMDEVRSSDIAQAAAHFRANATNSMLVLVGTSDAARGDLVIAGVELFHIDQLEDAASRNLTANELGVSTTTPDTRLASIVHLAEGYPLFIVLLARALLADDATIELGNDETGRWEATKLVIAGPRHEYGGDESQWNREALTRAKCLFAVILTGHLDKSWDDIWEQYGIALKAVLDAEQDWGQVKHALAACQNRQIVRRPDPTRNYRYVSPNNLARIVINHFVGPPDGAGPRIARHSPEFRETLFRLATRVQAQPALRRLAECELSEFVRRCATASTGELDVFLGSGRSLYAAAELLPDAAIAAVSSAILTMPSERFAANENVRGVTRSMLSHLVRRRVSFDSFSLAEQTLFVLARSEFETWGNNATGIWRSLFLVALSCTHHSWESRFALLEKRLTSGDIGDRRFAISGLEAAVEASEQALGYPVDEEEDWPRPPRADYVRRKREAWRVLFSMTSVQDSEVAGAARTCVAQHLRGAIVAQLLHSEDIATPELLRALPVWQRDEKTALLSTVADLRRYNAESLSPDVLGAVEALTSGLSPQNLAERLSNQVGDWHPGDWPIDAANRRQLEAEADGRLIEECITAPAQFKNELNWLVSSAAVRRHEFLFRLGARDRGETFLAMLEAHSENGREASLIVPYVVGWADAAGQDAIDSCLERYSNNTGMDQISAEILGRLIPTRASIARLQNIVSRAPIPAGFLIPLSFRMEDSQADPSSMLDLVETILRVHPENEAASAILEAVLENADLSDAHAARALDLGELALRIGGGVVTRTATAELAVERLAMRLAKDRRVAVAVDATIGMLLRERGSARGERLAEKLVELGHGDAIWERLASELERHSFTLQWALARVRMLEHVTPARVLEWVGGDQKRARAVARLVDLHSDTLGQLPRALIHRFGGSGLVAQELEARALSTPRVIVGEFADFYREQLRRAEQWGSDSDPEVRAWAQRVGGELQRMIEREETELAAKRQYA